MLSSGNNSIIPSAPLTRGKQFTQKTATLTDIPILCSYYNCDKNHKPVLKSWTKICIQRILYYML